MVKNVDFWLQRVIVRLVLKVHGSFWAQNVEKTMQFMCIANFLNFDHQMFRIQHNQMKSLVRNKKNRKKFNF